VTRDPKSDVLQLNLSRHHSLDVVRLPKSRKYRVVFAERFGVQRRAFVEISFDEAAKLALFLANVEDSIRVPDDDDPPTDPSRPSRLAPMHLRDMEAERLERDAIPEPLPPPPRRATTKPRIAVVRGPVVDPDAETVLSPVEEVRHDPRTGAIEIPLEGLDEDD
jgi:hypothetical protein